MAKRMVIKANKKKEKSGPKVDIPPPAVDSLRPSLG
jgi:hypothetical protein